MTHFDTLLKAVNNGVKQLSILVDPEKFDVNQTINFLKKLPEDGTHLFVGGSTGRFKETQEVVASLKKYSDLPVFIFPGNYEQICEEADALLFLSLLSGDNSEYLIGQQRKAAPFLMNKKLEILSTSYLLIDGGVESAVARVSQTKPLLQADIKSIVNTAYAGQLMGAKLVYLEAGSGAKIPVSKQIITAVKRVLDIPLIVGGGIRTEIQKNEAYIAGADMVVMGTVFE